MQYIYGRGENDWIGFVFDILGSFGGRGTKDRSWMINVNMTVRYDHPRSMKDSKYISHVGIVTPDGHSTWMGMIQTVIPGYI